MQHLRDDDLIPPELRIHCPRLLGPEPRTLKSFKQQYCGFLDAEGHFQLGRHSEGGVIRIALGASQFNRGLVQEYMDTASCICGVPDPVVYYHSVGVSEQDRLASVYEGHGDLWRLGDGSIVESFSRGQGKYVANHGKDATQIVLQKMVKGYSLRYDRAVDKAVEIYDCQGNWDGLRRNDEFKQIWQLTRDAPPLDATDILSRMTPEYLGGRLQGDGSIIKAKRGPMSVHMYAGKDEGKAMLEAAKEKFPTNNSVVHHGSQRHWQLAWNGLDAEALLQQIEPFLGPLQFRLRFLASHWHELPDGSGVNTTWKHCDHASVDLFWR